MHPVKNPSYDHIANLMRATDATELRISLDDIVRIEGAWRFKGRIDGERLRISSFAISRPSSRIGKFPWATIDSCIAVAF